MKSQPKAPALEAMKPFDACLTMGHPFLPGHPAPMDVDTVLAVMDRFAIHEALVHEQEARLDYPREHGNQRLLNAVRDQPRLHPVWVIEPPQSPDPGKARAIVDDMLAAGVRVARLPMKRIPPLTWVWSDLCRALEQQAVPAFLDFGENSTLGSLSDTDVNGIRDLALAHPGLSLVLSHVMGGLGIHPGILFLMHRVDNLYMDITGIVNAWRIIAHEVGPDRILFATGAPFTDPGVLISNIQYMPGFSDSDKKLMYGDNLRRLLKGAA